jgi:hypothetical protein
MTQETPYHIGTPNQKWGPSERKLWLSEQRIQRSYEEDVLRPLANLTERTGGKLIVEQYGALSFQRERYPLFVVKNTHHNGRPTALITGGVHGYETSGVLGALRFLETDAMDYCEDFNLLIVPCVSPWAYETINRWNPHSIDPNRSFTSDSPAEESAALMAMAKSINADIYVHIDLHETTDTDNTEFRPALSARDNVYHQFWEIPDGFYLVGDTENPCDDFQNHIVDAVSDVTHIAPSDADGRIIGELTTQHGVINYATKALGLCTGFSGAQFNTTTEVYPDSPIVDGENCILAQVMAICSGLNFALDANN